MCEACDALVTGVPLVESHPALQRVGIPTRTDDHAWNIDFRCADCSTRWHSLLDPDDRKADLAGAIRRQPSRRLHRPVPTILRL